MRTNESADIFCATTDKSIEQFIDSFEQLASPQGFLIHNRDKMNMAETFSRHGETVPTDFDIHMVQVCSPAKASKSMVANPERAALIPKFITVFTRDGKTQVRMLRFNSKLVADLLDDEKFSVTLPQSFDSITKLISLAL